MDKIDYKREFKDLYSAQVKVPKIVEVPSMQFIMADGCGDPNTSQDFKDAIEALYSLSYNIKFRIKRSKGIDYGVMPLEGLWWADDMSKFGPQDKDSWNWTLMIMQPHIVTKDVYDVSMAEVKKKKDLSYLDKLDFNEYEDGLSAQVMHIGPFSEEGPTIELLHKFIGDNNYKKSGKHREIYLSDMRRSKPEKYKTILRQPISR